MMDNLKKEKVLDTEFDRRTAAEEELSQKTKSVV